MAVLDVVYHPDDRLRARCEAVGDVTDEIRQLIDDMVETMYDAPGVGLAAPQVGRLLRIIVVDCSEEGAPRNPLVLINPEIVQKEGTIAWEEGCLSIPGVFADVKRAEHVKVRARDRDGNEFVTDSSQLQGVCIQHEMDHLDGVLFLDHLSRLKLRMALKTYKRTLPAHLEALEKKRQEAPVVPRAAAAEG